MNLELIRNPSRQLAAGLLVVTLLLDILIRRILRCTIVEKEKNAVKDWDESEERLPRNFYARKSAASVSVTQPVAPAPQPI